MPPADHTRESRAAETASEARQNAALAPNLESVLAEAENLSRSSVVHLFRADQRRRWERGERIPVETYLERLPAGVADEEAILDLIYSEVILRADQGESATEDEFVRRFPQYGPQLRCQFALGALLDLTAVPATAEVPTSGLVSPRRPACPEVPGYEVLEELGRGGMGVVYLARHLALKRLVALKMILTGAFASEHQLARFRAEAEAVARLQHPNIVQIYDIGEYDGRPFFALEYVNGGSLAQRLTSGPLEPRSAAQIVEALARGTHSAHQRGIIHRDLKPANILIADCRVQSADLNSQSAICILQSAIPKITDFGLAKQLDAESSPTQSGFIVGTPNYMAPEQAAGKGRPIGPRADVYALGAILYECLTGRPPFRSDSMADTILQVLHDDPIRPRQLNRAVDVSLEAICLKCLEKSPEDRYRSAEALADDLAAYLRGERVEAEESSSLRVFRLFLRETRHTEVMERWGRVLLCLSMQVLLVGAVVALRHRLDLHDVTWRVGVLLVGGLSLLVPVWLFRFRQGPPLSPIERHIIKIWGVIGIALLLNMGLRYLAGEEQYRMSPVVFLLLGVGFACMAVLLGGSFYVLAVVCAVVACLRAADRESDPLIAGIVVALGLFVPGWRYSRFRGPKSGP